MFLNQTRRKNLSVIGSWNYRAAFATFAHAMAVTQDPYQFAAAMAFALIGYVAKLLGKSKSRRQSRRKESLEFEDEFLDDDHH